MRAYLGKLTRNIRPAHSEGTTGREDVIGVGASQTSVLVSELSKRAGRSDVSTVAVVGACELESLGPTRQTDGMLTVRRALVHDEPFLREILAAAADWREGATVRSGDDVMRDPNVSHYLAGWPRKDDFGVIAEDDDVSIRAAWCRFFNSAPHGYGFVAPDVPELTIGVVAARRNEGIGRLSWTR